MVAADKQLEALRKEHKDLTDNIRRTAILMLTVLSLVVISFTRACKKTSGNEVKTRLCQINKAYKAGGRTASRPNISYIFELFPSESEECEMPCQLPPGSPSGSPSPSPEESSTAASSSGTEGASPSAEPSPTPESSQSTGPEFAQSSSGITASPTPAPSLQPSDRSASSTESSGKNDTASRVADAGKARECQARLEADLEETARTWFSVEAPIPGVKVTIDLRYWIFCFPVMFFLSGIYLNSLRRKVILLKFLGAHEVKKAAPEDVTKLDRLYFGADAPYTRFPSSMSAALFLVCYFYLPIYLIYAGAPFWRYWETSSLVGIGALIGVIAFYSISYAHFVTNKIDQQIQQLTDFPRPRNFINTLLKVARELLQWTAARLSPRIPLLFSSLLLLSTLFLAISQKSCDDTPHKGYEVVLGHVVWSSPPDFLGSGPYEQFARLVYVAALLFAVITIVVVLTTRLLARVENNRLKAIMFVIAGSILLFTILDYSFGAGGVLSDWETVLRLVVLLATIRIWVRYSLWSNNSRRERWLGLRPIILVLYTPFFLIAFWNAFQALYLIGLLVYLSGSTLLTLGFMHLHWKAGQKDRDGPEPPDPLLPPEEPSLE